MTWSGGKLCNNCLMELLNISSNLSRDHETQSANVVGRSKTRVLWICFKVSSLVFCWAFSDSSKLGLVKYCAE